MNPYVSLVTGWVVYFALHSLLATTRVKSKFRPRAFRMFYVTFSTVGLIGLMYYSSSIESLNFFVSEGPPRLVSLFLTIFGVMIIQTSFRQFSFKGFVGLGDENKVLQTHGVLQYIRHPIQAGIILIVFGFFLFIPNLPTLISCVCILVYIPIGLYLEEKKLVAIYGDQYIQYRKRVPAIIPHSLSSRLR
jgi:protein-S-isoprenylcysteine O-methyltransferase Ste14